MTKATSLTVNVTHRETLFSGVRVKRVRSVKNIQVNFLTLLTSLTLTLERRVLKNVALFSFPSHNLQKVSLKFEG